MIKVVATLSIKPNEVDTFLTLAKKIVAATLEADGGCRSYSLCEDVNAVNTFAFIEEWESQTALDAHMQSTHFVELFPKISELTTEPSAISILKTRI